jgi:hypothetical protein
VSDTATIVLVVVIVLVVLAALAAFVANKRKRDGLRERFGPEYDRTLKDTGGRRDAEKELQQRARRRDELDIRPLEPQRRDAFSAEWRATQEEFVDRPSEAVRAANGLVERVMAERGYPVQDFDQMARDVSVDHANVVSEYRSAHEISQRNDSGEATTEQLRQAMVHYRSLFADLLDAGKHDRPDRGTPENGGSRDRHPEGDRR